jgi:hypothetical protein
VFPSLLLTVLVAAQPAPPAPAPEAEAPAAETYLLMDLLHQTPAGAIADAARFQVSGWTDMTFTAATRTGSLLPYGFNYRGNEFQVQQTWIRLQQSTDPRADHPTFGFTIDGYAGTDYRFIIARGLFDGQLRASNGQPDLYGVDLPQFYIEALFPDIGKGLTVKVGKFLAWQGAGSAMAPLAPLASRSYTSIYTPFTHTGLYTELKIDDAWTAYNAFVLGSDVFIDPADSPTYHGGFKYAPEGGATTVQFDMIFGSGRFNQAEQFTNLQLWDLVLSHNLTDDLTWKLELMYGYTTNVPGIGFADWFGVVNYGTLKLTDNLSAIGRLEFYDDCQGQRTGFEGLYTAGTLGLNWKPCPALALRPEVRYDTCSSSAPFQGKHGLFTATFDVLLRY